MLLPSALQVAVRIDNPHAAYKRILAFHLKPGLQTKARAEAPDDTQGLTGMGDRQIRQEEELEKGVSRGIGTGAGGLQRMTKEVRRGG